MVDEKERKRIILDIERMNKRIEKHEKEKNLFIKECYKECKRILMQAYINSIKEAEEILRGIKREDVNFKEYVTKKMKENGITITARKGELTQELFKKIVNVLNDMYLIKIDRENTTNIKGYMIKIIEVE